MKPADLDGWWLNLPKALDRAKSMRTNLKALALENHYKRFEAGLGNPSAAAERELAVGEAGAWCSWLRLLEQASRSEAAIVHLLEDDTELTEGLVGPVALGRPALAVSPRSHRVYRWICQPLTGQAAADAPILESGLAMHHRRPARALHRIDARHSHHLETGP